MFPRFVNAQTPLMAASPANEITRLFSLLGVGLGALRAFAGVLIVAAALGLFVALYTALQERRYDLAMMRTLGASRGMLFGHVLLEGVLFALAGLALGLALGHAATGLLGAAFGEAQQVALTGWTWVPAEAWLVALALGVGLLAALVPALQAYRTDLATTLARA
jgi:putative ABC transport system permease protein